MRVIHFLIVFHSFSSSRRVLLLFYWKFSLSPFNWINFIEGTFFTIQPTNISKETTQYFYIHSEFSYVWAKKYFVFFNPLIKWRRKLPLQEVKSYGGKMPSVRARSLFLFWILQNIAFQISFIFKFIPNMETFFL